MMILALVAAIQTFEHEFTYEAAQEHRSVALAGSFNGWDRNANLMTLRPGTRLWTTKMKLKAGRHEYKFVLDGETWITDPKAKRNEDDGNGNINSILILLPPDFGSPAIRGDGTVAASGLEHKLTPPGFNFDRGKLTITLRARAGDLEGVEAIVGGKAISLQRRPLDDLYEVFRGQLSWNAKTPLEYVFRLRDKDLLWFGRGGLGSKVPFRVDPKTLQVFETPSWAQGAVFYQIFPERFANGNRANDPGDVLPWGSTPRYFNFMGGDLAGVRQKRDYLKRLGVGGVYLNPIFEGPSNHGYETSDYFKVAKRFGTNEEFAALVKEFKASGIRVVLDGVFNHTATNFGPFADIVRNGQTSKFTAWYWIKSYPVKIQDPPNYTAWFNFPSMPKVNLSHPEARKFFLSVPGFWKKNAGIDGWRLDVANEVQMDFWQDFRRVVKAAGKDDWIVGEVWGDGTPWLGGDQWDSIMGYQFRDAALRFVAEGKISASEFLGRLMRVYDSYAPQVSRNLMNLLGSHDTPRFLTLCGNDADLARLGATFLLTWPGSPSIYYGDELGMEGGADPDNRRCMEWERATPNNPMFEHYRRLIALRNGSGALRTGEPFVLATNDTNATLAYARVEGKEVAIVAANRGDRVAQVSIPLDPIANLVNKVRFADALGSVPVRVQAGHLVVDLGPKSAAVLLPRPGSSPLAAMADRGRHRAPRNPSLHPLGDLP